VAGRV
jgi:hypothetical protein